MDGHERESHGDANGQTVAIDEPFQVGGEEAMYSGDPNLSPGLSINCRCVLQPGGIPEERLAQFNRMFLVAHGSLERRLFLAVRGEFAQQKERIFARLRTRGVVI